MEIRIKNLRLQTIIGVNDWERRNKQDVVVNVCLEFDGRAAAASDNLRDAVDYKAITDNVADEVQKSQFFLLEKLASRILDLVTADPRVRAATVEVDKPNALTRADSVSVRVSK